MMNSSGHEESQFDGLVNLQVSPINCYYAYTSVAEFICMGVMTQLRFAKHNADPFRDRFPRNNVMERLSALLSCLNVNQLDRE